MSELLAKIAGSEISIDEDLVGSETDDLSFVADDIADQINGGLMTRGYISKNDINTMEIDGLDAVVSGEKKKALLGKVKAKLVASRSLDNIER